MGDKIDAAMDFEVQAARGYLDAKAPWNWVGRARDQKRYDLAIETKKFIRQCKNISAKPFSQEYDDMIKNYMEDNLQYYANEADRKAHKVGDVSDVFKRTNG